MTGDENSGPVEPTKSEYTSASKKMTGPVEPIKQGLPDPELEKILDEEEAIARNPHDHRHLMQPITPPRSFSVQELINRFGYHKPTEATIEKHRKTRQMFLEFAYNLDQLLIDGRAKREAFDRLDEACMWAQKAIAEQSPVVNE